MSIVSLPHCYHEPSDELLKTSQLNTDLHLLQTVAGEGVVTCDGQMAKAQPGTVLAVPAFTPFYCSTVRGRSWEMINLHYELQVGDRPSPAELPWKFHVDNWEPTVRQLRLAIRDWTQNTVASKLRATARLQRIIAGYIEQSGSEPEQTHTTDSQMQQARRLIRRMIEKQFSASALAKGVGLSVSQLNRRFVDAFDESPKQYWQSCRAESLRQAVAQTDRPLAKIAQDFSFSDEFYFSRWFKKQVGLPPGAFRQAARQKSL